MVGHETAVSLSSKCWVRLCFILYFYSPFLPSPSPSFIVELDDHLSFADRTFRASLNGEEKKNLFFFG
jgi:hypothetical protein